MSGGNLSSALAWIAERLEIDLEADLSALFQEVERLYPLEPNEQEHFHRTVIARRNVLRESGREEKE